MTTRKFGSSWWVDFRVDHTRFRKRSPQNSQAGAAAYEALLRHRLARGLPLREEPKAQEQVLFSDFAETWFRDYVVPNNKFSEQRAKRAMLNLHLVPFFGRLKIGTIGSHHLEQFKAAQFKAGANSKTIRNRLTVLMKCLVCAHEWLQLGTPVPKVKWPKAPPPVNTYLSNEESARLLAAAEGITYDMILLTLRTGMRQGEVKGLQWKSIDWQNRSLVVQYSYCDVRKILDTPKSGRARHIPLDEQVLTLLEHRRQAEGFVFAENGRPFTSMRINRRLAAACRAAGIRVVTWHALRHTFATNAAMRGVPLQIVQHLLGHSTVKTTERYAHVAPSMLRVAIEMMARTDHQQGLGQSVGNHWNGALDTLPNSQAA